MRYFPVVCCQALMKHDSREVSLEHNIAALKELSLVCIGTVVSCFLF